MTTIQTVYRVLVLRTWPTGQSAHYVTDVSRYGVSMLDHHGAVADVEAMLGGPITDSTLSVHIQTAQAMTRGR